MDVIEANIWPEVRKQVKKNYILKMTDFLLPNTFASNIYGYYQTM